MAITVYDTTLREGIQSSGLWLTVEDKLKIVRLLDRLGVHYIEAGNPAANQKDAMFFQRARGLELHHAKLAAFGSTCRKGVPPYEDENIKALLAADTPVVCVFGKCWDYHVERILGADATGGARYPEGRSGCGPGAGAHQGDGVGRISVRRGGRLVGAADPPEPGVVLPAL